MNDDYDILSKEGIFAAGITAAIFAICALSIIFYAIYKALYPCSC